MAPRVSATVVLDSLTGASPSFFAASSGALEGAVPDLAAVVTTFGAVELGLLLGREPLVRTAARGGGGTSRGATGLDGSYVHRGQSG